MAMVEELLEPIAIVIFAKAPIEGFAKTRLIPRLGAKGAADLQRRLIERTVRAACASHVGPVSLWCSPSKSELAFQSLSEHYALPLFDQIEGDLGRRMHHAFSVTEATMPALLVGTDCAVLAPEHFARCAGALRTGAQSVFIPVEDGGYILIGLRRPMPVLFESIPWGTAHVMTETRNRVEALGVSSAELPPLWDIDRPEDYDRAVACGALEAPRSDVSDPSQPAE
ncbi:MAG: DUF2064 domain-containing protein [Alphaproteobacteria bacterium]|nr:DUF2064 domain-containing protein [Alphaproteobacteria bacterium]